jgi:cytoskeletal protein CcmA (bactofilin family)
MVIGVGGYVEGDIVAKEVLLCGRLDGRIFAFNVTIAPSAVLKGRVFHHIITVAKEAQIEGRMPWRPINFFETLRDLPKET